MSEKIMDNKSVYSSNKMWSLKSLAKLMYERTSLYTVQYKLHLGSVLMICSYFENGQPKQFVLMFCWTPIVALFLACS